MNETLEQELAEGQRTATVETPPLRVVNEIGRNNLPTPHWMGEVVTHRNVLGEIDWTATAARVTFLHDSGYYSDMIADRVKNLALNAVQQILIAGGVRGNEYLMQNFPAFPGIDKPKEREKIAIEVTVRVVKLAE